MRGKAERRTRSDEEKEGQKATLALKAKEEEAEKLTEISGVQWKETESSPK